MKIPEEWLSKIYEDISGWAPHISPKGVEDIVKDYLNSRFNDNWNILPRQYVTFEKFFISVVAHQCNVNVHQLTCGVDSMHQALQPRITRYDDKCYLICPTCGYVQFGRLDG